MNMKKIVIGLITVFVLVCGFVLIKPNENNSEPINASRINNVEVRDGVQYVTINARGGYSPQRSTAKSGIPTKLVVKTNGTFDCSSALVIRSIGYQKMLPQTGEEVIDLGAPKTGMLQGTCGMGMYNFSVNFE